MIKGKVYYQQLIQRYLDNNCNPQEVTELFDHLRENESSRILLEEMRTSFNSLLADKKDGETAAWSQKMQDSLRAQIQPAKVVPFYKKWLPRIAAAVLFFTVALLAYNYFNNKSAGTSQQQNANTTNQPGKSTDIKSGGNKALLTLSDGSVIELDQANNGKLASQGSTSINKDNGLIVYDAVANGSSKTGEISFNTITTPNGGQYQIVLPDGSKVWLNAASSLRFPTAFAGSDRNVELTGEGYFEIEKNPAMPFHVNVNGMQVEVLGTHFNIMAYSNEDDIKTTLLEGSVKVNYGTATKILIPGQQAKLLTSAGTISVADADTEEAVAWKNGYFQFNSEALASIMRQFARWYDVEVTFEGKKSSRIFSGEIQRSVNLSQALKVLELSDVKFRVEGKKIVVM